MAVEVTTRPITSTTFQQSYFDHYNIPNRLFYRAVKNLSTKQDISQLQYKVFNALL